MKTVRTDQIRLREHTHTYAIKIPAHEAVTSEAHDCQLLEWQVLLDV